MKKIISIALLCTMVLTCFAGCGMQKGELYVADEANVQNVAEETTVAVGITDALRANANAAKNGALTEVDIWDKETKSDAWYTRAVTDEEGKITTTIESAAELVDFREKMNKYEDEEGKIDFSNWTITLTTNIDLNGASAELVQLQAGNKKETVDEVTVYYYEDCFEGVFDGGNHVISNYTMTLAANGGFFGTLMNREEGTAATIKNLAFVNVTCEASATNVASVAGYMRFNAKIENVYSNATMKAAAQSKVSGLIASVSGTQTQAQINNCEFDGDIENGGDYNAGILAAVNGGSVTLEGCVVSENASIKTSGQAIGGVIAYVNSAAENGVVKVSYCVNSGIVEGAGSGVGGVVGQLKQKSQVAFVIEHSVNNGSVNNTKSYTGGIIGVTTTGAGLVIDNCVNNGTITAADYTGGILGGVYNNAIPTELDSCVNNGAVIGGKIVGGIIGGVKTKGGAFIVNNCKNTATVTGTSSVSVNAGDMSKAASTTVTNFTNLVMAGYQTSAVVGDKYDLRFVAAFDDANAIAAGFKASVYYKNEEGKQVKIEDATIYVKTVYKSINGGEETYAASEFGGEYLYTLVIKDIPADYTLAGGNLEVLLTPFTAADAETINVGSQIPYGGIVAD